MSQFKKYMEIIQEMRVEDSEFKPQGLSGYYSDYFKSSDFDGNIEKEKTDFNYNDFIYFLSKKTKKTVDELKKEYTEKKYKEAESKYIKGRDMIKHIAKSTRDVKRSVADSAAHAEMSANHEKIIKDYITKSLRDKNGKITLGDKLGAGITSILSKVPIIQNIKGVNSNKKIAIKEIKRIAQKMIDESNIEINKQIEFYNSKNKENNFLLVKNLNNLKELEVKKQSLDNMDQTQINKNDLTSYKEAKYILESLIKKIKENQEETAKIIKMFDLS